MPRALIVEIIGDATQFGHELDKAAGKTRQMGQVAGVAGLALAGGLALGLEQSVKAAEAMQVSTAKMDAAFKASGFNAGDFTKRIDEAESSSRKLGFSNIDVRDSLGGLVVATHSGAAAIKDLSVAEDLARFKHISLSDATKIMTSAMAGSTRAARQLGLQVQATTTNVDQVRQAFKDHTTEAYRAAEATAKFKDHQATAAAVVALVSDKLHGQAQAFADTAAGGMAQFHAQIEALQEKLGAGLLPILTQIAGALASAAGYLAQHTTVAKIAVGVIAGLAAAMIAASIATTALNLAFLASPIGLVVIGLAGLAAAFVVAYKHSETFRQDVQTALTDVKAIARSFVDFFKAAWAEWGDSITTVARNSFNFIVGTIRNFVEVFRGVVDIVKGIAHGDWAQVWQGIKEVVSGMMSQIVNVVKNLGGNVVVAMKVVGTGIKDVLVALAKSVLSLAEDIGKAIVQGIDHGFTSLLGGLKDKIVSGVKGIISGAGGLMGHLGIHSPSTYMADNVGAPMAQGIGIGFLSAMPALQSSLESGLDQVATNVGQTLGELMAGSTVDSFLAGIEKARTTLQVAGTQLPGGGENGPKGPPNPYGGIEPSGNEAGVNLTVQLTGPVYGTVDAAFARTLAPALASQLRSNGVPQLAQAIKGL